MYEIDGIVYGDSEPSPEILSAEILHDRIMKLVFSNGEIKIFDANSLVGEVFEPLKSDEIFTNIVLDHGVVTWLNGEIDCSPDYMYNHGETVSLIRSAM